MGWFFGRKRASQPDLRVEECLERLHRLEIQTMELMGNLDAVAVSHKKLLKRTVGELGGRPRANGGSAGPAFGDKEGLRQHYAGELAARARGNIPRE